MIVVLDACVLYPPSLRDLLLTLAALDAFEVRWSDQILDEVTRNVIGRHPQVDADKFTSHTIGSMRRAFPEASVRLDPDLIETLDNDPKDRHVAAAAIITSADAIVTNNLSDFESDRLREEQIEIVAPGAMIDQILDDVPEVVTLAIDRIAGRLTSPPRTPTELVELLAVHPTMAAPMERLQRLISAAE